MVWSGWIMGLVGSCPTQPIFDLLIKAQAFLFLNQPIKSNYISRCKFSFYFAQKKTTFFYFTHSFLQNTHISLSILHIYSIKYSLFFYFLLFSPSPKPISLITTLSLSHRPEPPPHKPSNFSFDEASVHHAIHHVVHRLVALVGSKGWSSFAATAKVD